MRVQIKESMIAQTKERMGAGMRVNETANERGNKSERDGE